MSDGNSHLVRIATSELLFQHLNTGVTDWLQKRFKVDSRGQHTTQLSAVSSVLQLILAQLEMERKGLDSTDPGALYENCERFDRRTVWLERLWQFFRGRFDQREDEGFTGVLRVADEVVWSCYSRPLEKATALGLRTGPAPAPLPFIEARYAPEAFPTELVPPDLRDEGEATSLLKGHLNKMPTPVVRMTPSCVAAPWLVVYLAHEVGHHLQYDLLPQRGLVAEFRQLIEAVVQKQTDSGDEAQKWGGWSKEIFADVFSVISMGPWAVWAMVELEFKSAKYLNEERDAYPSPAMRLALLAEACDRVTGTGSGTFALRNLLKPEASSIRSAVLDAALGVLPGLGTTLATFCAADPAGFAKDVTRWQSLFEEKDDREPQPQIENAPVLTGAALATWRKVAAKTSREDLAAACRDLGVRYIDKVVAGAPDDGPRGGNEEADVGVLAQNILDMIWQETR
jgi:hypothetical protein